MVVPVVGARRSWWHGRRHIDGLPGRRAIAPVVQSGMLLHGIDQRLPFGVLALHVGHGSRLVSPASCERRRQGEKGNALRPDGCTRRDHDCGTGTSRGLANHVKPAYCFICLPLPRLPPEQLSILLMQLSIHMLMTVLSQAPNQSAWNVVPGRDGVIPAIVSEER